MSEFEVVGRYQPETLSDLARPLVEGAKVVVCGWPIKDADLPQATLSLVLQAATSAGVDLTEVSTQDVVAAYATAYAAWASTIADNASEFEDAVIALARAVHRAGPAILANRRGG